MGTATAFIRKYQDANEWTLTVGAIKKKATANIPDRAGAYQNKSVGKCVQA